MFPWFGGGSDGSDRLQTLVLLRWTNVYRQLDCKLFRFEETLSVFDAPTLQNLRSLSLLRDSAVRAELRKPDTDLEELGQKLHGYVAALRAYTEKVYAELATSEKRKVCFEWNSPLSNSNLSSFFALNIAEGEHILALVVYSEVLRCQAFQKMCHLRDPPDECSDNPDTVHGTAANILRRAAGALKVALDDVLPSVPGDDVPRERPSEMYGPMLTALHKAALGEAQAIMADRAEQKHTSPALTAALYRGASDLFEQAAAVLRKNGKEFVNGVSSHYKRYLAISASLQEARARRLSAAVEQAESHSGKAMAHLRDATKILTDCIPVAENEAQWLEVLAAEQIKVDELSAVCDKERCLISFEPIPGITPPLPDPKAIVSPVAYEYGPSEVAFY